MRLLRTIYRFRRLIAVAVLLEWAYKARKSKAVNWYRHRKMNSETESKDLNWYKDKYKHLTSGKKD